MIKDLLFSDLPNILNKNDLLIFNNTKVIPALMFAYKGSISKEQNYKKFEFLLVKQIRNKNWFCICKPLKKVQIGDEFYFSDSFSGIIISKQINGVAIKFLYEGNFYKNLEKFGLMPLPPYIRKIRNVDYLDNNDYQSYFSNKIGSIASPTASLHFDQQLSAQVYKFYLLVQK